LKLISNDSKYLQNSNLLKPPKGKHSFWFQERKHFNEMIDKCRNYYPEYLQTRNQLHRQNHKKIQKEIREFLCDMENDWWEKNSQLKWSSYQHEEIPMHTIRQ